MGSAVGNTMWPSSWCRRNLNPRYLLAKITHHHHNSVSTCKDLFLTPIYIFTSPLLTFSVRVSNELGAGDSKAVLFSILVTVVTSTVLGILFTGVIFATHSYFPRIFSGNAKVTRETSKLGYLLGVAILLNSIQPILNGVVVGAGWQVSVSLINIGCYYVFGLPLGGLLGYKFKLGVSGIWSGLLAGVFLQRVVLLWIMFRANWHEEAEKAEKHMETHLFLKMKQQKWN